MTKLNLKIKKAILKRKLDGVTLTGYYGRVVTNGKKDFDEIARASARNTTLHPKEASLAAELLLEGVVEELKQGYIVDLGPLGTVYPAVNSPWKQDADELVLDEMKPKVNYKATSDILAAVKGATLAWATKKDETEGTDTPADDGDVTGGEGSQTGGGDAPAGGDTPQGGGSENGGSGGDNGSGDLEG